MRLRPMKVRMFAAPLAVSAGLLLAALQSIASPMSGEAGAAAHIAEVPETASVSAAPVPVMVDEAASPTHFGDAKPDADFRVGTTAEHDPYQAMLREIVLGAAPNDRRTAQAQPPTTADDDSALNFYSREELKSRIEAVKGGVASLMGSDGRTEQSEEARELELERRIGMRGAYDNARLSGGAGATGSASGEQRQRAHSEDEARLYLIDFAFFVWDILTHPVSIAAYVLIGIIRAMQVILRLAPGARRVRRHGGKRRRSRSTSHAPQLATPRAIQEKVAANIETEKPKHRRRRRKRRRSFFSFFRSA